MSEPGAMDLLEALPHPVALIDGDERIAALNVRAERLMGPGLRGRHYAAALRQPALLDAIESVRRGGEPRTARYLGREGERDSTWAAHVTLAGEHVLISFEDRTQTEEAGQMRRDFVANVSHELKTPLTAMMGFIETLRGPAKDDTAARERFLGIMEGEAKRMNRLVQDLLSLSRVEADERVRPTDRLELGALLASVLHTMGQSAPDSETEITFDRPEGAVMVTGDSDQLRQVFTNLIENAVKYGGRKVEIRIVPVEQMRELRGPGVRVEVQDDGPGIDPIHLPRLSERFYRVDTHRSRAIGGTGLGLAIVKHIVARHRGRLRISSAPGEGSTFTVLLPLLGDEGAGENRVVS